MTEGLFLAGLGRPPKITELAESGRMNDNVAFSSGFFPGPIANSHSRSSPGIQLLVTRRSERPVTKLSGRRSELP
jgi:hypothetical protein